MVFQEGGSERGESNCGRESESRNKRSLLVSESRNKRSLQRSRCISASISRVRAS